LNGGRGDVVLVLESAGDGIGEAEILKRSQSLIFL
jgi:hypothetical protein